jgi:hypothetical protein
MKSFPMFSSLHFGVTLAAAVGLTVATLSLPYPPAAKAQPDNTQASTDRDPLVDTVANGRGRINFNAGVVKATGYGAPPPADTATSPAQAKLMALGAARADALRTLAMTVSSIQVTAETKVKNYVLQRDVVETRLSALLQSPRVISESVQPDGTAVVVVELPLYGSNSVASAVFPEVLPEAAAAAAAAETASPSAAAPAGGAGADENGNFHGPAQPAIHIKPPIPAPGPGPLPGGEPGLTPLSDNGPFSAVIIDCRGLNVEAIMSPKLYDTTGREVYGTVRVSYDYAVDTGIVGYPRSMAEAIRSARAGSHPLIVRGLRTADRHRLHPVISLEDADRILAANNRDHFLEQTRVIFLVDPVK